jgi:hypothetical protein
VHSVSDGDRHRINPSARPETWPVVIIIPIRDGSVWINNRPLEEPYVTSRGDWNIQTGHLMPDHYALLGDNRELSLREHPFIVVSRGRIMGRIL